MCREPALHLDLLAEALEGALGDEGGDKEGERRQNDDDDRDDVVDDEHHDERDENGHDAREQLRRALQEPVGDDVDVVDDARHHIPLRVAVHIADARGGQTVEGVATQVADQLVTQAVDTVVEEFLRKRGEQDAQRKAADEKIDGSKVDLSRADHLVDGKTVQDGPHEHETDVKNTEHKRADHIPFIRTDVVKEALCETFFQSLPVHAVLSCESHISLYSSHEAYSSSCVPRPTIFPSSIAKMMSAFFMEDARWEMRMVVTSLSDAMFARTFASVAKSSAEQLSSRMRISGFAITARAMVRRWRCPPEKFLPPSPTG